MHKKGSMTDTYSECAASLTQTFLFVLVSLFLKISSKKIYFKVVFMGKTSNYS